MEPIYIKLLLSLFILLITFIVYKIIIYHVIGKIGKIRQDKEKSNLLKKSIRVLTLVFLVVILVSVWGIDFQNIWLFMASILGLIAIGFVAVWSILSNIFAGLVILATRNIRMGDQIELLPEKIKGELDDISLFYITIKDPKGAKTYIPNNVFIQKMIKKFPKR